MSGPWWAFALLGAGIAVITLGGDRLIRWFLDRDIERMDDQELLDQETQRYYDEESMGE